MLNSLQIEMLEINYLLFKRKIPFIVVYEGWDARRKRGEYHPSCTVYQPAGIRCCARCGTE